MTVSSHLQGDKQLKKPNFTQSPTFSLETGIKFSNLRDQKIAATSNDITVNDDSPPTNASKTYLPPPVMLKSSKHIRDHMKVITKAFPKIRNREKYQYHVIAPKAERPIKVVIKGLPSDTEINDIKSDLTEQRFPDAKVTQLIRRTTKQALPVFMITLPCNINNAKNFQLKTLSYLSSRVEGYEGTGLTQCYSCNRFNHTAENCHMIPCCLKCREAHQTKDYPIQRVESAFCINCRVYGHMANYSKCPFFPKPRKA
ncbi:nucleic-acid-binding protein from transposon X-element [Trichonephila clavipes]|uniref:Nucleic-acid-binding protein from transposon X-element n=1 Tax=Trichonephila clavipes TaxID=2585209 RepID=A0A8X6SNZ4_TRICX|nr:nucleic-acid-binding protein from transposon X-element [Trichonephila clavipes]